MEQIRNCQICGKPGAISYYDRHGVYSGRACPPDNKCSDQLPGQGDMWNYEPQESVDEED